MAEAALFLVVIVIPDSRCFLEHFRTHVDLACLHCVAGTRPMPLNLKEEVLNNAYV